MKITKSKLKKIIKEELNEVLKVPQSANVKTNISDTEFLTELNLTNVISSITREENKRETAMAKTAAYLRDLMKVASGTPTEQVINKFYLQVQNALKQGAGSAAAKAQAPASTKQTQASQGSTKQAQASQGNTAQTQGVPADFQQKQIQRLEKLKAKYPDKADQIQKAIDKRKAQVQ
tara:strand:- start:228 stop:758 length:531 start_codon:yes stop_codon:yes gene_type:complete